MGKLLDEMLALAAVTIAHLIELAIIVVLYAALIAGAWIALPWVLERVLFGGVTAGSDAGADWGAAWRLAGRDDSGIGGGVRCAMGQDARARGSYITCIGRWA